MLLLLRPRRLRPLRATEQKGIIFGALKAERDREHTRKDINVAVSRHPPTAREGRLDPSAHV